MGSLPCSTPCLDEVPAAVEVWLRESCSFSKNGVGWGCLAKPSGEVSLFSAASSEELRARMEEQRWVLCGAHRVSEMPAGNPLCVQTRPAGCLGILIGDSGSLDWGRMPFSILVGASISVKETCVGDL